MRSWSSRWGQACEDGHEAVHDVAVNCCPISPLQAHGNGDAAHPSRPHADSACRGSMMQFCHIDARRQHCRLSDPAPVCFADRECCQGRLGEPAERAHIHPGGRQPQGVALQPGHGHCREHQPATNTAVQVGMGGQLCCGVGLRGACAGSHALTMDTS